MNKILALLFLLIASPAYAANYWVSKSGSDAEACNASASPLTTTAKLTVAAGVACLSAGDTLSIRTGTYEETLSNPPGNTTFSNATTIKAHTSEVVTLRKAQFNTSAQRYIIVQDIIFDGNFDQGADEDIVNVRNGAGFIRFTTVTARKSGESSGTSNGNCVQFSGDGAGGNEWIGGTVELCGWGSTSARTSSIRPIPHGFYISTSNNLIDGVTIQDVAQYGVHLYSGNPSNNIIRNNIIRRTGSTAVTSGGIIDHGDNNQISFNIISDSEGGYLTGTTQTGGKFYSNTIYGLSGGFDGGYPAIQVHPGTSTFAVKNNIVYNNTNNSIVNDSTSGSTSNNQTADPRFADAATGDFRLCTAAGTPVAGCVGASTAIDAGTASIATGVTIDVFNGAAPDIGAKESPAAGAGLTASLTADDTVAAGAAISVTVDKSAAGNATDWVAIYEVGAAGSAFQPGWQYMNGTQTATVAIEDATLNFTAPLVAGNYEFRIYQNGSEQSADLLDTETFTVTAPASVSLVVQFDGTTLQVDDTTLRFGTQ